MRKVSFRSLVVAGGMLALSVALPTVGASAQTGPAAAAPAVLAEQDLGGETLKEYCQSIGYSAAQQSSASPTGWWCAGNLPTIALSLDLACRWQYADMVAVGFGIYNVNGNCKTVATSSFRISDLGRIAQYCQSLGYTTATANAVGVVPNNVAAWRCVDSTNGADGVAFKIDLHAACRWVNPAYVQAGYTVVSYFPRYGAYLEITCIAVVR